MKRINRLLLQLLGLDLFSKGLVRLLARRLLSLRNRARKQFSTWVLKGALILLLVHLVGYAILLSVVTLALYLNAVLGSNYQGFVWSSGLFVLASSILSWLAWVSWAGKSQPRKHTQHTYTKSATKSPEEITA